MTTEVFLDDTPGEVRGVVMTDGRCEHLLIQRESDRPRHRLGARSVGRVASIEKGQRGAFIDLGGPPPMAFLPLRRDDALREGQKVEVVVVAEPREGKGATMRLTGEGAGEPRLLEAGATVEAHLARLAPGVAVQTGVAAIQAAWDAEEEALADGDVFADSGLDLAVQRTRAMIAVDIDHVGLPGRDARKGRAHANLLGLKHAARIIRLKRWGGLVAIDLVGVGQEAQAIMAAARAAFGDDPDVVFGPLNRFGVLSLSLPWRRTPIEEVLRGAGGTRTVETEALDLVRRLRRAMLSNTASAGFEARCAPVEAAIAGPLAARLGPRARVIADPAVAVGRCEIEET